jgi:hypothetical protein
MYDQNENLTQNESSNTYLYLIAFADLIFIIFKYWKKSEAPNNKEKIKENHEIVLTQEVNECDIQLKDNIGQDISYSVCKTEKFIIKPPTIIINNNKYTLSDNDIECKIVYVNGPHFSPSRQIIFINDIFFHCYGMGNLNLQIEFQEYLRALYDQDTSYIDYRRPKLKDSLIRLYMIIDRFSRFGFNVSECTKNKFKDKIFKSSFNREGWVKKAYTTDIHYEFKNDDEKGILFLSGSYDNDDNKYSYLNFTEKDRCIFPSFDGLKQLLTAIKNGITFYTYDKGNMDVADIIHCKYMLDNWESFKIVAEKNGFSDINEENVGKARETINHMIEQIKSKIK